MGNSGVALGFVHQHVPALIAVIGRVEKIQLESASVMQYNNMFLFVLPCHLKAKLAIESDRTGKVADADTDVGQVYDVNRDICTFVHLRPPSQQVMDA